MQEEGISFYGNLLKLLNFEDNPCSTTFGFKKYFSMDELLIKVWNNKSGNSFKWFKKFESLDFIKKVVNEGKPKYCINVSSIKKFIKKDSIFSMILKRIEKVELF